MSKKKYTILAVSVIITIILLTSGIIYYFKEAGVMEQIYRAAKEGSFKAFNEVEALRGVSYEDLHEFENFGGLSIPYKDAYLREKVEVELFFPAEGENIKIRSFIKIADCTLLIIHMSYDHKNHMIVYEPISISNWQDDDGLVTHFYDAPNINQFLQECDITREDIAQYQEYMLYDVVIKTWIDTHGGSYEKARKKMEAVKLIDRTYEFKSVVSAP